MNAPGYSRPGQKLLRVLLGVGPLYWVANLLSCVRFVVRGDSMAPLLTRDRYVMVSRLAYLFSPPQRGDIVVLRSPAPGDKEYIKRIVGLPGEHVRTEEGQVFVNDHPLEEPYVEKQRQSRAYPVNEWFLADDEYFVLGDNRDDSHDSRSFGPLQRDRIIGKAWFCYWPRTAWGRIAHGE